MPKRQSGRRRAERGGPPADPRLVEGILAGIARAPGNGGSVASHKAQELTYDAWEAQGTQRIAVARRALALWPDCADAWVIIAEETGRTLEHKLDLYEKRAGGGERDAKSPMRRPGLCS